MFRNRLYYQVKPLIPASTRLAVRRWFATRKREQVKDCWPILPGSEKPPQHWPGWPEGKQFAVVLTHDVEGPAGLAKCRQLMKLEMDLGFRSSFNFIPDGSYSVPKELRDELIQNGFEIGVHDLNHDGKLFRNRAEFSKKATRINRYLKDWGAVGFRSGFMLRNREWLHQLDVAYDASTFDTDPFEPQPDGVGTIFPFWVPNPLAANLNLNPTLNVGSSMLDVRSSPNSDTPLSDNSKFKIQNSKSSEGYVELPYTLPQDSTLFLLFRESNPDIWIRKLDWIARHGGMALLNVHPDYIRFDGEANSAKSFPVEFYIRFLKHVSNHCAGRFWHVLPREVAEYVADINPRPIRRSRPLRICMVTHSHYARDNRVIRYAEALAARGDEVDVLSLRPSPQSLSCERLDGVNVFRLHDRFSKKEGSALGYLWPILQFFAKASIWLTCHHDRRKYDLCHIHNIPDFLVFTAWYPRLRGARIILDIHDVVPEFFASKFSNDKKDALSRRLLLMERWSARFADRVIIANHLWLEKYAARTRANGKCSVFINNVNATLFQPRPRTRNDGKLIILFPGGLQWHQGLDIAIRAFPKISARFPQAEFHIYGDGNMKSQLQALTVELGLQEKVLFYEPVTARKIAEVMADADLGIVPKRADSFGDQAYSTKIMEFMSLGVPMVVSNTTIDRFYFNDCVVRFFESGNPESLAAAVIEVLGDDNRRQKMVARAKNYAVENSWETRKTDYFKLVDSLGTTNS